MDILERYLYEVGRRLPAKQRDDIIKELRSLLMDALEAKAEGGTPTEEDAIAVLREFGKPETVAARYIGEQYVVGPRLYPVYKLVLIIVLAATAFGLLVSIAVGYSFGPATIGDVVNGIVKFFSSVFSGLLSAVGSVTLVFWVIERLLIQRGKALGESEGSWNPKTLPPVPSRQDRWKPADSIITIVFSVIALVVFNAFPDYLFFFSDASGQLRHFPFLSNEALQAFLPLWNIGWALTVALHTVLLVQGRWRLGTNLAHIGIQVYSIIVLGLMIAGPKLLNTEQTYAISAGSAEAFHKVVTILNAQLYWVFILAMIGTAVGIGKAIYRIVRDRP